MKHSYAVWQSWRMVMLFFLLLTGPVTWAQAPAWQQAAVLCRPVGGGQVPTVTATTTDVQGNVYLAGYFSGAASFDNFTLTSTNNGTELFVAKWSPAANMFMWAQQAHGTDDEIVQAVAVSGSSIYVAGSFRQSSTFGSTTITPLLAGYADVFVAKLTEAGASTGFTWAQKVNSLESSFGDRNVSLAVNGSNVYVATDFAGQATVGTTTVTSAGAYDILVAKLVDAGSSSSFAWAKSAGSPNYDFAYAVAATPTAVYVTGTYSRTATFDANTVTSVSTSNDIYVAKLADAGSSASFAWVRSGGGAGDDYAYALAVSGTSVYVAGNLFSSTAAFGGSTLTNAGLIDVFIAKLTDAGATGTFTWAQRAGGVGADLATSLAASGTNVYVAGMFTAPFSAGSTTLTSAGARDVYVAKLVDAGATSSFAWARSAGGADSDAPIGLGLTNARVYVAGTFVNTASFGSFMLNAPYTGGTGNFVAALADPTLTATTAALRPEGIGLFPNPAHGRATVQLPAGTGAATLTVLDALGRPVRTQTATGIRAELDLTGLVPGLYAVRVQAGGATATQRLVVE